VISALLTEQSIEDAAVKAGVGSRSIHRWLREDAAFQAAYNQAKREVVRQAQSQLQRGAGKAVAALIEVLDDPLVQASAKVSAARTILEYAVRAVELDDLDTRVQALERVQLVSRNGGRGYAGVAQRSAEASGAGHADSAQSGGSRARGTAAGDVGGI
jgi:ribosomal protein L3